MNLWAATIAPATSRQAFKGLAAISATDFNCAFRNCVLIAQQLSTAISHWTSFFIQIRAIDGGNCRVWIKMNLWLRCAAPSTCASFQDRVEVKREKTAVVSDKFIEVVLIMPVTAADKSNEQQRVARKKMFRVRTRYFATDRYPSTSKTSMLTCSGVERKKRKKVNCGLSTVAGDKAFCLASCHPRW